MADGRFTSKGILEQDAAWASALASAIDATESFDSWLQASTGPIVFTGCGSSFFLGHTAADAMRQAMGAAAFALPASEWLARPEPWFQALGAPRVIAISRSGETADTVRLIREAQRRGCKTLALTCSSGSALAGSADLAVECDAGADEGQVLVGAFSSMLLAALRLVAQAAGSKSMTRDLRNLPALCRETLRRAQPVAEGWGRKERFSRFVYLGSGPLFGLAQKGMLLMKEMALAQSESYPLMEFRHGLLSAVDAHTLVIALLEGDPPKEAFETLEEVERMGASVIAVAPEGDEIAAADDTVRLPAGGEALARLPLYTPFLQLFAYYRALQAGRDPDRPRNLENAVT